MTNQKLLSILLAAGMGLATTARAELVKNGGFELTVINGGWQQVSAVAGWTSSVSGGSAFEVQKGALQGGAAGFNPYAYEGQQYLELNAASLTSVSQSIVTNPLGHYQLSFAYAGRPDTANGMASLMNVYWGDTKLNASPLVGQTNGTWSTFSMKDLIASSASTILRFESIGPAAAPTYGSYLDAVSVNGTVPEPASAALILLGMAGLALTRRTRGQTTFR